MTARFRFTALLLAAAVLGIACDKGAAREPQPPAASATPAASRPLPPATPPLSPQRSAAPAPRRYTGALPPLPRPDYPLPRPFEVVRAVYDFAARRPDVLHYVPCFCGCEASGHVGNDDCFVGSRDANGKPTWDLHGMG